MGDHIKSSTVSCWMGDPNKSQIACFYVETIPKYPMQYFKRRIILMYKGYKDTKDSKAISVIYWTCMHAIYIYIITPK